MRTTGPNDACSGNGTASDADTGTDTGIDNWSGHP